MKRTVFTSLAPLCLAVAFSLTAFDSLQAQRPVRIGPPADVGRFQSYQDPFACLPCHARQFAENRQSVKSGYRNFSPTFNALELAGNYAAQGALEAGLITNNLRPVYDRPNFATFDSRTGNANNLRGGFCFGCHAAFSIGLGATDKNPQVAPREIPPWDGLRVQNPNGPPGQLMIRGANTRPLRDYHFIDANGNQVLPRRFGGMPPAGARTSLAGYGVNCDFCHNLAGAPDFNRSLQGDGFANASLQLVFSNIKVGPFKGAFPVRDNFHASTSRDERINYVRSAMLCNACHDVRVPTPDIVSPDSNQHSPIGHFRLENLSTEWAIGPYNDPSANPFGQVVRCQDCHMSLYPYAGDSTYSVTDPITGDQIQITSPTPGVFPINFAAEGERGIAAGDFGTRGNIPLPRRKVVTHYFTGIDVPLLYDSEMKAFLNDAELRPETTDYARRAGYFEIADLLAPPGQELNVPMPDDVFANFPEDVVDEHGIPLNLRKRRDDLARAAVRIDVDRSDPEAALGHDYTVRLRATALTGHRLPAGFSQERGVWVQLTVAADRADGEGEVVLYQSGYLVDKPHPETNELEPDGNFHDEDQEHLEAIVNPFTHDNEVFQLGPDNGPHARIFEGVQHGLVFFRNELVRIYGPRVVEGTFHGVPFRHESEVPRLNRRHPRTFEPLTHVLEEETFSAGLTSFVDNWRSLPPLVPRHYRYEIHLPSAEELHEFGMEVQGPLKIRAAVHFQHFPPLFLRFLARVGGAYVEKNLNNSPVLALFEGLRGPADRNLNMWTEQRIDDLLRIVFDIAEAEITVPLEQE